MVLRVYFLNGFTSVTINQFLKMGLYTTVVSFFLILLGQYVYYHEELVKSIRAEGYWDYKLNQKMYLDENGVVQSKYPLKSWEFNHYLEGWVNASYDLEIHAEPFKRNPWYPLMKE